MSDQTQNPAPKAALYYPYIHIRSEHWLKATLLCALVVKRIVPDDYVPEDQPNIRKYTNIKGPGGELLHPCPPIPQPPTWHSKIFWSRSRRT